MTALSPETRQRLSEADARHLTCQHEYGDISRLGDKAFSMQLCQSCRSFKVTACAERPEAVTGKWVWDETCRLLKDGD